MKAMVYSHYGPTEKQELAEMERPAVEDDEILVRAHATSLNWLDWHFLTGTRLTACIMSGVRKPKNKVLGIDVAGEVAGERL